MHQVGFIEESVLVVQYILVKQRELSRRGGENIKIKRELQRFQNTSKVNAVSHSDGQF